MSLFSIFVSEKSKYNILKITIMKKSLLIAFCCSMFFVTFVSAETKTYFDIHLQAGRDQTIRPTSVNSSVIPVTAGIDEDLLSVNFSSSLGSTTIIVEDSFGEVIYEETMNVNGAFTLPISLAGAEAGTYFIQIKTTKNKWYAEFDI